MKNYNRKRFAQKGRLSRVARDARKRSLKLGVKGYFTKKHIENLYVKQCGRCACCGVLLYGEFDVDHIIPLSRGGTNEPTNIQLLTPSCNGRKYTKTMEEFLNEQ